MIAYPDKFRVEADLGRRQDRCRYFAGSQAWVETPAGVMDADA